MESCEIVPANCVGSHPTEGRPKQKEKKYVGFECSEFIKMVWVSDQQ